MASSPIDTESLYAAAPQNFVAERKRLAKALRDAGRRDEAKAIERLSRPTVSVWAVNQLARREPARVKELGALAARLRDAQSSGGGGAYAETAAGHRAALAALRARAEEILIEGGHKPSPQLLARIVGNLRAGVANAELRPRIEEGRLERDLEETGFSGLFELPDGEAARHERPRAPAAARPAAARSVGVKGDADERARREQLAERERARAHDQERERARVHDREREQARARDRERELALADAERKARPLRAAAAAAGRTVERAARAAEAARAALADAERNLASARADETRLAKELAAAEAELAARRQRR